MGLNQGLHRLQEGFSRKLTKSEQARGYLFISKDKSLKKLDLEIVINKDRLGKKKFDGHGRIGVGRKLVVNIGNKEVYFKLRDNQVEITY